MVIQCSKCADKLIKCLRSLWLITLLQGNCLLIVKCSQCIRTHACHKPNHIRTLQNNIIQFWTNCKTILTQIKTNKLRDSVINKNKSMRSFRWVAKIFLLTMKISLRTNSASLLHPWKLLMTQVPNIEVMSPESMAFAWCATNTGALC